MPEDEILKEVWRIRDEYAKSFAYELDAIYSDLKQKEDQGGRLHVTLPSRKPVEILAIREKPENKS